MGGTLFKADRLERSEYQQVSNEIESTLSSYHIKIIEAYKNKPSFGDMDILVDLEDKTQVEVKNELLAIFNPLEYHSNGNIFSIVYGYRGRRFQIDFILTESHLMDISFCYFSYNDLGNLLGRLTKKLGIKLGHQGLFYIHRNDTEVYEVLLSTNWFDALELLEVSSEQYRNGFNELEDIFKFVASSPYFSPDIFLLHNRNYSSRIRDAKRKTYRAFLEWCETYTGPSYEYGSAKDAGGYGNENNIDPLFMENVHLKFPFLVKEIEVIEQEIKKRELWKSVVNGHNIGRITGLFGKELGGFMTFLKTKEYLLEMIKDGLLSDDVVLELLQKYMEK